MAYNPYFPNYYANNPYLTPMQPQMNPSSSNAIQTPQTANNGITWVQGEASAKSYPVAPNQSVLLMDSEDSVMYIKSTDSSGMPMPLRIFDYKERKSEQTPKSGANESTMEFVSRAEFDEFKADVKNTIKNIQMTDGEG